MGNNSQHLGSKEQYVGVPSAKGGCRNAKNENASICRPVSVIVGFCRPVSVFIGSSTAQISPPLWEQSQYLSDASHYLLDPTTIVGSNK